MRRRRLQDELIKRYRLAVGITALIVAADVLTKKYAATHFVDNPVEVIPGFLGFSYTENPGAAFSLFQQAGPILGGAAIAVCIFVLWSLRNPRPRAEVIAFGFVLGGAVGNLVDRVFRGDGLLDGRVIDWIDLWWIPTFNIADAAVTTAVCLFLIQAWRTR